MKRIIKKPFIFMTIIILSFQSCSTIRADIFLYKVTTKEDKARLLYNEGLRLYTDEFKENNNLEVIPKITLYLSDALSLDPTLENVYVIISELKTFKYNFLYENLDTIKNLSLVENRTEDENYRLVLSIKQANELKTKNKLLKEKTDEFKYLIPSVVAKIEKNLTEIEKQILIKEDISGIINIVINYKKKLNEILKFDNKNSLANSSLQRVNNHIISLTDKSLSNAKVLLKDQNFIQSEFVIRKTEQLYISYFKKESDKIILFKYTLFQQWGENLYKKGNYQTAKNITKLAYGINRSNESLSLLNKIDKAISITSFESTINDILESIDFYIKKEDPVNAQKVINNNINKFKTQKNKNSLIKKKDDIDIEIARIYNEGILLYQDESFEGALERFSIVYKYNVNHKQIKDYYDRTVRKVKVLSGTF